MEEPERERETLPFSATPKRLAEAYAFCRLFARVNARHFYYAFLFLPSAERRAIHALYSFCQKADQLVDLEPSPEDKRSRIARLREDLRGLEGELERLGFRQGETSSPSEEERAAPDRARRRGRDPIMLALAHTLTRFSISTSLFHSLLDGLEMDLDRARYRSFEELERYCWHVASTVGLMVIEVFGYGDAGVRRFAEKLGQAMQLTNMARDVLEDGRAGRVYLPQDLLHRHDYGEQELRDHVYDERFRALMREFCDRSEELYRQAFALLPATERRRMKPALVMANLYRPILAEIRARDYNVFLGKVGYPVWRKLTIALNTLAPWN